MRDEFIRTFLIMIFLVKLYFIQYDSYQIICSRRHWYVKRCRPLTNKQCDLINKNMTIYITSKNNPILHMGSSGPRWPVIKEHEPSLGSRSRRRTWARRRARPGRGVDVRSHRVGLARVEVAGAVGALGVVAACLPRRCCRSRGGPSSRPCGGWSRRRPPPSCRGRVWIWLVIGARCRCRILMRRGRIAFPADTLHKKHCMLTHHLLVKQCVFKLDRFFRLQIYLINVQILISWIKKMTRISLRFFSKFS